MHLGKYGSKNMKVLVTGHLGYIGTVLIPMLLKHGHTVVGMDSDLYMRSNFGISPEDVPNIKKDIRDAEKSDLDGFETVIHLAGLSNDPLGDLNPKLTYEINHHASVRLAELSKEVGISRFLFSSSCSTYGASGDDFITEEAEFHPVTPYGESKVLVEKDISHLADENFSPTFLRNATAFGVSPRLRFDLVLNNLTAWAFTTGQVYLKSDGTPWRPIVHIADISSAFIAVLHAPRELIHNQAFNVGRTDENFRVKELAEIVKETVPGCDLQLADGAGPDKRNYRVDCNKIVNTLPEFEPQWTAKRGAQELYQAYKQNGLELSEFEGPRYRRVDHIRMLIEQGLLDMRLRWTNQ
jgi:nucleoside-diphosphate-sugar epimerase